MKLLLVRVTCTNKATALAHLIRSHSWEIESPQSGLDRKYWRPMLRIFWELCISRVSGECTIIWQDNLAWHRMGKAPDISWDDGQRLHRARPCTEAEGPSQAVTFCAAEVDMAGRSKSWATRKPMRHVISGNCQEMSGVSAGIGSQVDRFPCELSCEQIAVIQ